MSKFKSQALVFFGATGELACKEVFPAFQSMLKRGRVDVPVIGAAKADWDLAQLRYGHEAASRGTAMSIFFREVNRSVNR